MAQRKNVLRRYPYCRRPTVRCYRRRMERHRQSVRRRYLCCLRQTVRCCRLQTFRRQVTHGQTGRRKLDRQWEHPRR